VSIQYDVVRRSISLPRFLVGVTRASLSVGTDPFVPTVLTDTDTFLSQVYEPDDSVQALILEEQEIAPPPWLDRQTFEYRASVHHSGNYSLLVSIYRLQMGHAPGYS
jgi:hypothetical protein